MATVMITPVKPFKLWFKWDRNVGSSSQSTKRYSIIVHVKIGTLTSYIMESRRCEPRMALCLALLTVASSYNPFLSEFTISFCLN